MFLRRNQKKKRKILIVCNRKHSSRAILRSISLAVPTLQTQTMGRIMVPLTPRLMERLLTPAVTMGLQLLLPITEHLQLVLQIMEHLIQPLTPIMEHPTQHLIQIMDHPIRPQIPTMDHLIQTLATIHQARQATLMDK